MVRSTRACTVLAAILVSAAVATGACGTSSTNNAVDGGTAEGGAPIDGSVVDAADTGALADSATAQDAGCVEVDSGADEACVAPKAGGATLYDRLGGHGCIRKLLTNVVAQSLKDPQLASYFVQNLPCTRPGHPTPHQLIACFTDLVGSAAGGTEAYPSTTPDGWACRSMKESHSALHVPNDAFDKLITTAAAVAVVGNVSPQDIAALGALLGSTRAQIVDPTAPDGGFFDGG